MKAYLQRVAPSSEASFVFRVKADKRFGRGWHCHPEFELTYIIESRGRRFVGDSIENYQGGDCILLGPNLPHTWLSENQDGAQARGGRHPLHRAIVVQFREDFLGEEFLMAPELAAVRGMLKRSARGLRIEGKTREEVKRRLLAMKRLSGCERLLELLSILQAIASAEGDVKCISSKALAPAAGGQELRRIDRVLLHLEEHSSEAVAQADVARLVGLSPAGFSRFFRRATGRTFIHYLSDLRVSRAASLLADTPLPILEVALRSGFNNLSNFNRRFLALRGLTPRAYRVRHAEARR